MYNKHTMYMLNTISHNAIVFNPMQIPWQAGNF